MSRKTLKRVKKLLSLFAAGSLFVASTYQMYSLAQGVLGKVESGSINIEEPVPTPKYPYKSCGSDKEKVFNGEFKPDRIVIDSVGIDLPVVSVPLKNGTWKVNANVANFAEETSLVNGREGNVGIYAHDRKIGFTEIKNLKEEDTIVVYGESQNALLKATYSVKLQSITTPNDVEVFYPTEEPVLTLVTCSGTFSEKRLALKAKLVSIEELNCNLEN